MRFLILFLFFASTCYADLYVLVDKGSKEVLSASEKNDTIPGPTQEIKVLSGSLADFTDTNPTDYKLSGTKLIKNLAKIDAQEQALIVKEEVAQEEELIQKEIRNKAIQDLKAKGVIFKHAKEE